MRDVIPLSETREGILADKQVQLELAQPRVDGRALLDAVNQAAARLGYKHLNAEVPKKFLLEPGRSLLPAVDPADLRRVFDIQQELQKKYPSPPGPAGTGTVIMIEDPRLREIANLATVWFRLTIFMGLRECGAEVFVLNGLNLPGIRDEKPGDTVFRAFATVPMIEFQPDGPPHEGWPFDAEELTRLLQEK